MIESKVNLLIVDDSAIIRRILKSLFKDDAEICIKDEAVDGREGIAKIKSNEYDLVLLDYEMPKMNGLDFLNSVKNDRNINNKPPIIVFSSLTAKGSEHTVKCLMAGAEDYILKPSASMNKSDTLLKIKRVLKEKILSIAKKSEKLIKANEKFSAAVKAKTIVAPSEGIPLVHKSLKDIPNNLKMVLIGTSTGGPAALMEVLKKLPKDFPLPILVVIHMPANFTKLYAESLEKQISLPVKEVTKLEAVKPGTVYLAAGGKHMIYEDGHVNSVDGDPVNFCIPAVDVLFESVANNLKIGNVISVVLTGMGQDGKKGVKALKDKKKCYSVVQDQASSVVWAMPRAVHEANLSDKISPLGQIGEVINYAGKHGK